MEDLNYGNTYFTIKGMRPDEGEDLTITWARALANNLANGYGIVGTVSVDTRDTVWINHNLTKIYAFPPRVNILYEINHNGTMLQNISDSPNRAEVRHYITGDLIGFRVPTIQNQRPTGTTVDPVLGILPSGWTDHTVVTVYYRIHGV